MYCAPARHLDSHTGLASGLQFPSPRCLCGQLTAGSQRCLRHRDAEIVVLDGDPDDLKRLADLLAGRHPQPGRHPDPEPPDPPGRDGPELPPIDR